MKGFSDHKNSEIYKIVFYRILEVENSVPGELKKFM